MMGRADGSTAAAVAMVEEPEKEPEPSSGPVPESAPVQDPNQPPA
jgi:hypothetical protein